MKSEPMHAPTRSSSSLVSRGVALIALSFAVACGGPGNTNLADSGSSPDGGTAADSGEPIDGGDPMDDSGPADAGDPTDGGGPVDSGDPMDGGSPPDSGESTDGGSAAILPVNLGTAGEFVILAASAITNAPTSLVTGDVGVSPAVAAAITGFALVADPSNTFSISDQVTGRIYAANYMPPTPDNLTMAIGHMMDAYSNAAGRTPDVTELGAGNIDGMSIGPGVYRWSTAVPITMDVTLVGSATDVWIFQIAQTLAMSAGVRIELSGGALPKNVFWQVVGAVTLGAGAHCEGVILARTSITLGAGASITGRLLAQTAVTVAMSTVIEPAP